MIRSSGSTDNSFIFHIQYVSKKTQWFYVTWFLDWCWCHGRFGTVIRRSRASKSIHKAVKSLNTSRALKPNRKGNSKINNQIKKSLYNWNMNHPQVVQSPIFNYCLKFNIGGHTGPQIDPKLLLQVSVWELHNILVSYPVYGELKEIIDADNNIIIIGSTLRSFLPPKF